MLPTIYCAQRKCKTAEIDVSGPLVDLQFVPIVLPILSAILQVPHERQVQHVINIEKLALP